MNNFRNFFPIFNNETKKPLAYLDSAASSQKPLSVIERMNNYYQKEHANIHRGAYRLSALATQSYEDARNAVSKFLNASDPNSIIFTRGTTESINLITNSLINFFNENDVILLTLLEHHSNIVPWQLLAEKKKLKIEFVDINEDGTLKLDDLKTKIKTFKPKIFSFTHISNALGTINPITEILEITKNAGVISVLDAAQSVAHLSIDLQSTPVDFLAFSGHKLYGPTGIGVLYASKAMHQHMEPFMGGGDMIKTVTVNGSTWAEVPQKFEAGTPPIAEALGLHSAIDFFNSINKAELIKHDENLLNYAFQQLSKIPNIKLYGPATNNKPQSSILSFNLEGVHPHDLATVSDNYNVQFRAGTHCAMPLMNRLNIPATARISFGVYSTKEDIDQLIEALTYANKLFL
jgi:cysteine desulfurase/selenocysteine lyase